LLLRRRDVEPTLRLVYPIQPHAERRADSVDLAAALTPENLLALHEVITIVRQGRNVHEPLDKVFGDLDEKPERGNRGDETVEYLPHTLRHERQLFPFHHLPLGVVRGALGPGRQLRDSGKLLSEGFPALFGDPPAGQGLSKD